MTNLEIEAIADAVEDGAWYSDTLDMIEFARRIETQVREECAAPEQPVQPPVAVVGGQRRGWFYLKGRPDVKIGDKLYAVPPDTTALLRQALVALDRADKISGHSNNKVVRNAINKHLEEV